MAKEDILDTPGFKTPMPVGSMAGDAFDAPPAPAPGGPPPDPIGNITPMKPHKEKMMVQERPKGRSIAP